MASVPKPFTLPNLSTKDKINHKGQTYGITNVGAASDDGNGLITYAITINDTNSTVLNRSAKNTILMSTISDVSGNVLYQSWI